MTLHYLLHFTIFIYLSLPTLANRLAEINTIEGYTNTCLKGRYHKQAPQKEKFLYNECARYQQRSCCSSRTSMEMYSADRWHGLSYDHCHGHRLSSACRNMFLAELCLYECSPNLGPWLVKVYQKSRQERPFGVPLCRQQCQAWWSACRLDYTCVTNWGNSFKWIGGHNHCPNGSVCETFQTKFRSAEHFCESVWDGGYKVVNDSQACFRFDFNPSIGNPNDQVALKRAREILFGNAHRYSVSFFLLLISVCICFAL